VLNVSFSRKAKVTVADVRDILAKALAPTGCPTCGLGGLDVILRKDDIIAAQPGAWVAVLEAGEI
jgi:hypothetical protein